jgi:hypothetical protein
LNLGDAFTKVVADAKVVSKEKLELCRASLELINL